MELVMEAAGSVGVPLPLSRATTGQFRRAIELGHGEADVSACFNANRAHAPAA
jgi:3-hydroxyisobutyrate dehydrogenase-like beta-hydroxyacid dehydrogenase